MNKNHDYRLPLMRESIRLTNVPASISRIKEIKVDNVGHIVEAQLRIDGIRNVPTLVFNVLNSHTSICGQGRYLIDYADLLTAAIVDYESYLTTVHI